MKKPLVISKEFVQHREASAYVVVPVYGAREGRTMGSMVGVPTEDAVLIRTSTAYDHPSKMVELVVPGGASLYVGLDHIEAAIRSCRRVWDIVLTDAALKEND